MYVDDNTTQSINYTYKIWKKNVPFLYNMLHTYYLTSCSQSVYWFSEEYVDNDWRVKSLLMGSNSITKNCVYVASVSLPTDEAVVDYTTYSEYRCEYTNSVNFVGTMGLQQLQVKTMLPQSGEILKARINPHEENIFAVKIGGENCEVLLYDLRSMEDEIYEGVVKLIGHTCEGMALSWNPIATNQLLSGSYDCKVLIWDTTKAREYCYPIFTAKCDIGIEDIKCSKKNQHIFATASQKYLISIWDTRYNTRKATINKKAHVGEVYTLDFNPHCEQLLLSGGYDSEICLWDLRNMSKKFNSFIGHNDCVSVVSWCPTAPLRFASGSFDRRIVVWDVERCNSNAKERNGNYILFIHGGHRSRVTDLSWEGKEDVIASCEESSIMQVWKMNERILTY